MISVKVSGSFRNVESFLHRMDRREHLRSLARFGPIGVSALEKATPEESGRAAGSWYYKVIDKPGYYSITWYNSDIENGFPVVIMLQYGHGTRNGGYVEGKDFINPAIQPVFDKIRDAMWKEVTR